MRKIYYFRNKIMKTTTENCGKKVAQNAFY